MEQVKKFIREHPHMWWGLYLPVYLTMFFIIEHLITDNYWATQTAIDDYIPFCEWFVFPYDSWSFLLVAIGIYLIVKDAEGFRRYMWTIMITFTTATVFCALVPNGQDLRPAVMEHQNIAAWLLQNTYNLDTNTNVLPSVHVLGVVAGVAAAWHTPGLRKWGWRAGPMAWARSSSPLPCLSSSTPSSTWWRVCWWGPSAMSSYTSSSAKKEIACWQRERGCAVDIIKTPILEGITPEEQEQMRVCFGVREEAFRAGETIYDFSEGRKYLGLIAHGSAVLQRIDRQGGRAILEHLESGGVFGEMLMFENVAGDSITVIAEEPCRVWFMQDEHMTRRCERACAHHSRLVENMFHIMTEKAAALSERVEVLSRRSIREKLLCYFGLLAGQRQRQSFQLPFSLSALADYISADRSAMMRELKKMKDERLVEVAGRQVTLCGPTQ